MLNKENGHLTKGASLPQARATDLVTREMPDELLVYDLKRHKAHCLNQTAALVWKHCDGQSTVTDITRLIERDLNATVDEGTVWLAVERLGKANLLEERVVAPAGSPKLSRRDAIRKMGLVAALAAPVVISIVAPTAASAQTCRQTGYACTNTAHCCQSPYALSCESGSGGLRCCRKFDQPCTQNSECCTGACNKHGKCRNKD